ncbi:MAG: PIN domain-containing protein [Saprospiraceae bacterium]
MQRTRRYLFAAYAEIETLDFEHLEKVCDRMFILIPDTVTSIPFTLVRRLQRLGKGVKWIPSSEPDNSNLSLRLAFLMGRLHQKLPTDIEFAILSDDATLDPLVQFILDRDRRCLRVRASRTHEDLPFGKNAAAPPKPTPKPILAPTTATNGENGDPSHVRFTPADAAPSEETTVRNTATEVVERLVRSGNRPAEVATLKQYISLLNHQMPPIVADKVVTYLAVNNDIEIRDKEVVYNF